MRSQHSLEMNEYLLDVQLPHYLLVSRELRAARK
jgi:hypothetical protein